MPLNKSHGNMYKFCTNTWNPVRGHCAHQCVYCYLKRFVTGDLRLVESEFKTPLGEGNTIFVGSSTDMWADNVPYLWIKRVLEHCRKYPNNTYLFQTKNPKTYSAHINPFEKFPDKTILGITIETNRSTEAISKAPNPIDRAKDMALLPFEKMISVEPILDFDLDIFVGLIERIQPTFVSIGADSKGHKLPEPSPDKVLGLMERLTKFTEVRIKSNLRRIIG